MIEFDGMEVFNAGVVDIAIAWGQPRKDTNSRALAYYQGNIDKCGAAIGSSDNHGHFPGRGRTGYQGEFFDAIRARQTVVLAPEEQDLASTFAFIEKMFGSDVVRGTAIAQRMMRRRNIT